MAGQKKGGLGRGLAALIPTGPDEGPRLGNAAADVIIGARPATPAAPKAPADKPAGSARSRAPRPEAEPAPSDLAEAGAVYRELAPTSIQPNPQQPRSVFDEEALAELVHSIREFGLMQPIVVRPLPAPRGDVRYELVMGERRWRASQEAGLAAIPAIVRETADGDMLRDALLENIHRVQLNPLEEAAAYAQLLEEFGVTHDELASRLGRSRPVVTNTIRLLRLPVAVQRRVAAGVLSAGHARALLSLEAGSDAQEVLAARIVAEGMSVRATEEAVTLANRGDGTVAPAPQRRQPADTGLRDLADRIADRLDTKVTVSMGKRKGKIVVEVGSADDLERIVALLAQG
ncbi:ParB/RepB/Spo0J family partition protein [Tsukamurella pseudospumae]|uniref:Chromosome partitioning protein n=1 Tax=Tsukamurella pseudospumae TaxID=239498 RepID=A0A137ZHS9_9ACTN|nr:ParB/RepB/Spo0J family partition protein [Tsukamurella pseudospumae]KXO97748.1 chromosome partitioning protein [Tsukamurella pseudospumae]